MTHRVGLMATFAASQVVRDTMDSVAKQGVGSSGRPVLEPEMGPGPGPLAGSGKTRVCRYLARPISACSLCAVFEAQGVAQGGRVV